MNSSKGSVDGAIHLFDTIALEYIISPEGSDIVVVRDYSSNALVLVPGMEKVVMGEENFYNNFFLCFVIWGWCRVYFNQTEAVLVKLASLNW
ncbi:9008_t:CDS:2 [Dentiscutata heterogama]|uniref:9008_t:CDS:1 n=1 Tax=Dentiscutata heterogama TaxID=1316150 RepID=A0ACA9M4J7_9GLOM|nr:9008_t:CDS:2 [Dentiscutata heterogama]